MIDTHCHLNDERYEKESLEDILKEASELGIDKIIVPAFSIASSYSALKYAKENKAIYSAIGIHPLNVDDGESLALDITILEELLNENKDSVLAIGEIGLDFHYEGFVKEKQKEYFRAQLDLAYEYEKPIIIHTRDSMRDTIDILLEYKANGKSFKGVFHCFSGDNEDAKEIIEKLDFYVSFGGPITFKNNDKGREILKDIPMERILLETDAPYLTPHPYRGKTNYPKYVSLVYEKLSEIKNITLSECESIIKRNVEQLFSI